MLIRCKNDTGDSPLLINQRCDFETKPSTDGWRSVQTLCRGPPSLPACPIGCIRQTSAAKLKRKGRLEDLFGRWGPNRNGDLEYLITYMTLSRTGVGSHRIWRCRCVRNGMLPKKPATRGFRPLGKQTDLDTLFDQLIQKPRSRWQLRNGTKRIARSHPDTTAYAMQTKGVEMSGQEPRQAKAFGLALACPTGGGDWGYGLPTLDISNNVEVARTYFPDCI